jgi:putative ATPase
MTTRKQPGLFAPEPSTFAPLAERMRPRRLEELVGSASVVSETSLLGRMLRGGTVRSLILWGPPGCGKTTIARLLADRADAEMETLSAVLSGVKELREVVARAEQRKGREGRGTVLFVDEIHRFNKAQQDAFLPHVESGTLILIGATTENPSFEVIAPLLSRCRVVVLEPLVVADLEKLVDRALTDRERGLGALDLEITADARRFIADSAHGDARAALGSLEAAADFTVEAGAREITLAAAEQGVQRKALLYDKAGEEHYNVVSAFIKSLRGGDADAALYWLARMLAAGEDPLFIARRMVIFASEDVGLADPAALPLAIAVKDAVHFVGLPEGRISLAHGAAYLALAPKSNASYAAFEAAAGEVEKSGPLPVPKHLRNAPTTLMRDLGYGRGYVYPHGREKEAAGQRYLPDEISGRRFLEISTRREEE